jgi:hypothetical protein
LAENPEDKIYLEVPMTDDWEKCDSCEEGVDPAEAFFEEGKFYHPDCAGVWYCVNCGKWNDEAQDVCECGEKKA